MMNEIDVTLIAMSILHIFTSTLVYGTNLIVKFLFILIFVFGAKRLVDFFFNF